MPEDIPTERLERQGASVAQTPLGNEPASRAEAVAHLCRIAMWDRLRILAFIDVVSFHVTRHHALFGVGLPLFLILSFGLGVRHPGPRPAGEFLTNRFRRLIVPWLAWSAILAAAWLGASLQHNVQLDRTFHLDMLLYGPERYLWFLPFAFIGGFATHLADRATQGVPTGWLVTGCLAGATALLAVTGEPPSQFPFRYWLFGAPAAFIGLASGRILARPAENTGRVWFGVLGVSVAAIAFLLLARQTATQLREAAPLRYAIAVAMLAAGALLPDFADPWTRRLQPLLLGGYLLHAIVYYQLVNRLARVAQVRLTPAIAVTVAVCTTLAIVAVMRRTRLRSIL